MVIIVLAACPTGLRGHLTRWMLEISPGVFVGTPSQRVRELMWERVVDMAKDGRALMVHSSPNEQRLEFRVHKHDWEPVDVDGVWLIRRPAVTGSAPGMRQGWSRASRARRARRSSGSK